MAAVTKLEGDSWFVSWNLSNHSGPANFYCGQISFRMTSVKNAYYIQLSITQTAGTGQGLL